MSTVHTSWCTFAPIYQIVSEQFKMCCCFCLGKEIAPLPQTVLLNAEFLGLSGCFLFVITGYLNVGFHEYFFFLFLLTIFVTDFFYELGLGLVQILIMFVSWILSIQCCFMNTQYNSSHSWKKKTGWHQQLVSLAFIWISYKLYTVFVLASMTRTIVYINNK